MDFRLLWAWILVLVGSFTVLTSIPLVFGWVPMNRFGYGFPFAAAFTSEENWYAINRFGGWLSIALGVLFSLAGLFLFFGPSIPTLLLLPVNALVPVGFVVMYFLVYRYSKRFGQ